MKVCPSCGNYLEEDIQFCTFCGTKLKKSEEIKPNKKQKKRFKLKRTQKQIFRLKILPLLFFGSIIWLVGELFFTFFFGEINFDKTELIIYIIIIIIEIILFLSAFLFAKYNKISPTIILYSIFCFLAGYLSIPIVNLTIYTDQVHMFVSLTSGSCLIVLLMAVILKKHFFKKDYIVYNLLLFLSGLTILVVIFILVFSIQNYLLTILIIVGYIIAVCLSIMLLGARVMNKHEGEPWILLFIRYLGFLLISFIIAIMLFIIIIIFLVCLVAGNGDFNLSGYSLSGGKPKKKKDL